MKTLDIVLVRCPQPLLVGARTGGLYSSNRTKTPEPTLPQLEGIVRDFSDRTGILVKITQLDLRYPGNGKLETREYGRVNLGYLEEPLVKTYEGVSLENYRSLIENADFAGFTNNFTMSRNVVLEHIRKVRQWCPDKEIWIGGRDAYPDMVVDVYAEAAGRRNAVVFNGHVFESLPAYLSWKATGEGEPFGVTIYDGNGQARKAQDKPLALFRNDNREVRMPLPVYNDAAALAYFTCSGEGQPYPAFRSFVHATFSIGCPNECGYCTTGYREKFFVVKDMGTIERELAYYKSLGVSHIAVMDDNYLILGAERLRWVSGLMRKHGFKVEYGNGLQLSLLARNWEAYRDSVLGHCESLYCPLEDLTMNRRYDKLDSTASQLEFMRRIAREAPEALKYLTMGVIVGVPGHTKESLENVFLPNVRKFLDAFTGSRLKVAVTTFNYMVLLGTRFGDLAFNSGRMAADILRKHPEVANFELTSYAPEGMTHKDMFRIYERALNLNPASVAYGSGGKEVKVDYVTIQRKGEMALPADLRDKMPPQWREPGKHLRAEMPKNPEMGSRARVPTS